MMFKINRVEFLSKWVCYFSVVGDDCFISTHDRTGLSDEQARHKFIPEHNREVVELMKQKRQREGNGISK